MRNTLPIRILLKRHHSRNTIFQPNKFLLHLYMRHSNLFYNILLIPTYILSHISTHNNNATTQHYKYKHKIFILHNPHNIRSNTSRQNTKLISFLPQYTPNSINTRKIYTPSLNYNSSYNSFLLSIHHNRTAPKTHTNYTISLLHMIFNTPHNTKCGILPHKICLTYNKNSRTRMTRTYNLKKHNRPLLHHTTTPNSPSKNFNQHTAFSPTNSSILHSNNILK